MRQNQRQDAVCRVAIAGNPNAGKTSVFNAITGARQRVGNYPGVTVERKTGRRLHHGVVLDVIDLPGTYSLTANSDEERIARDTLIDESPDVVVCVIDASNLERNLYLAVQLAELGVPLVVALNMIDVARSRGIDVDVAALERALGAPVVPTVGHRGEGIDALLDRIVERHAQPDRGDVGRTFSYGRAIDRALDAVTEALLSLDGAIAPERRRWVAIKLVENDPGMRARFGRGGVLAAVDRATDAIADATGTRAEVAIAQARYDAISGICRGAVRQPEHPRRTRTERIDAVVTHRVLGLPLFLALMYGVFQLTFAMGDPLMDLIEAGFGRLGGGVEALWPAGHAPLLRSLMVDAIIGGVGGVVVFLPNILLLFFAISLLEGSGYMARAAFIMDRLMQRIGLHGKSFIPMLIGFGCSVPAIMATRTLDNRRDRLVTMLVIPLVSCSARLPIYLLIIPAFFPPAWHAPMLFFIYIIGIVLAVVAARLLRRTVFRGETSLFLMELPPYRMPTLRRAVLDMWERGRIFLRKAGTMILGVTVVLWALTTFPRLSPDRAGEVIRSDPALAARVAEAGGNPASDADLMATAQLEYSLAGRMGRAMEPVIGLMGFDWKIGTGLIGAFAAKEVFVAQMGTVYSIAGADENSATLRDRLRRAYSPLVAFCIMLYALISTPCLSTVAVMRRESNSWRWPLIQFWGLTAIAYVLTVVVYQVGIRVGPLLGGVL